MNATHNNDDVSPLACPLEVEAGMPVAQPATTTPVQSKPPTKQRKLKTEECEFERVTRLGALLLYACLFCFISCLAISFVILYYYSNLFA